MDLGTGEQQGRRDAVRSWFVLCFVGWVLSSLACAWLAAFDGFWGRFLAAPTAAVAGAFGAVVLGSVLFERWHRKVEEDRVLTDRREWLHRNLEYALRSQVAVLGALADVVAEAYGALAPVLGDDRVPEDLLRGDVTRQPAPVHPGPASVDEELAAFAVALEEGRHSSGTGPLATCRQQVTDLHLALLEHDVSTRTGDGRRSVRTPGADEVDELVQSFTQEEPARLRVLAETVRTLTPDLTGVQAFAPRELRAPGVSLVAAVKDLVVLVGRPVPLDARGRRDRAAELVVDVGCVLDAASDLRGELWGNAEDLFAEAGEVDEERLDLHTTLQRFRSALDSLDETRWELWRFRRDPLVRRARAAGGVREPGRPRRRGRPVAPGQHEGSGSTTTAG